MLACKCRNGRLASLLVDQGADVNAADVMGRTALMESIEQGEGEGGWGIRVCLLAVGAAISAIVSLVWSLQA